MRYYYGSRFKEHWEDIAKMIEENYSQDYDDNDCLILSTHLINNIHNGVEIIEDYNPDYNKKIVYQLEPLVENHWCEMTDMINCIRDYDEVWDYDLNNIEILKQNGIDAKFKPLIYSENLKRIENKEEPDIDVLFYGTQTDYRIKTISTLIGRYLYCDINFISINNVTGSLLDDFISRSKIILDLSNDGHLHQGIQKQTRIFYALINNKCVISEKSDKNYFGNLITEVNIDEDLSELGNTINDYIYNKKWKEYLNVSDKFKQMTENNLIKMRTNNNMSKIREILNKFNINGHNKIGGTDKDSSHSYVEIYEQFLEPILEKDGSLLEIGIQYGGSILLWNELLKNCRIFGIDIEDKLSDSIKEYVKDYPKKITLEFRDAYCQETIDHIKFIYPRRFDIIIDDGPHTEESQLRCIDLYLDLLKDEGILVIEDIQNFDSIKVFIENIPESKFFDYEPLVFDLRDKKNRYDDIIFAIKKKVKKPTNKIAIFYHVGQFGNWKRLFQEQINSLVVSGLYHICDFIHIGVNGDEILPVLLPKFKVEYNSNKILEADTLKSLYDFCIHNKEHRVLYFHTKGATQENTSHILNVNKWRYYLEYFAFHRWKDCVTSLEKYDTSGTEYLFQSGLINQDTGITDWEQNPHYSGNYWWANASYICKLDSNYLYRKDKGWDRYRSEFWIGTGNPNHCVFYDTDIFDKYIDWGSLISPDYVKKEEFIEPLFPKKMKTESLTHKKPKIVMISMFKNESKGIRRMLESVYKHIDFYVFQDNGSTDGTPDIVKEFFADKNIPGFIYNIEEGWVGFGWNRDHLLQTCIKTDHGCDWIMKMDCDEYLEVDDDFDWSPFYNTNTESFNVTAQSSGCIYYRAWIWNAKLPWKFQHDPAHEIIYLDNEKEDNFERLNLPRGLRMIGTNDGESYTVRTKYITDALKLEERLIREETMLTDTYHFWYIAKSYQDCYGGNFYPLKEAHSKEFARRFIFYFEEYLKHMNAQGIHEMSYFSAFSIGIGHKYLGNYAKAIEWFHTAEKYCSVRNEHIVYLAQTYDELKQYDKMLEQTTKLINPERKLPFPDYYFLINSNIYCDSSDYPQNLHNYALSKVSEEKNINSFSINITTKPRLWIVDDFYADPHAVREFALQQEFEPNLNYYKGSRSNQQYIVPGTKEEFEKIVGKKITNWTETHGMCGRFQYCTAEDALVYHCDGQTLAGMIYLTPDAPYSCGTSLFAHKDTKLRNENDFGNTNVFESGYYDKTKFELVDTAGNVFNRLVLFDAKCIHSANEYFGTNITNSRLFHLFFFD